MLRIVQHFLHYAISKWFDDKLFILGYPLSLLTFEMAIVFD